MKYYLALKKDRGFIKGSVWGEGLVTKTETHFNHWYTF